MSTSRRVHGITPLLQGQLTKQLGKVGDFLDEDDLFKAFRALKTLIIISPPRVKQNVMDDLDGLEEALTKTRKIHGVDLRQTRKKRLLETTALLRHELRPLFDKVMTELYAGNYLEIYARDVPSNLPRAR